MPRADLFDPVGGIPTYWITRANVPACLIESIDCVPGGDSVVLVDMLIDAGRIKAVEAAATRAGPCIDVDHAMVWPGLVDMHTHLDKGHIWPRRPNPDGTFASALAIADADRAQRWTAHDLSRRMDFALRCAIAHGTTAIRTHLDSIGSQFATSWDVFDEVRDAWSDRIALQGVSLFPIEDAGDPAILDVVARRVGRSGGVLGAVTYMGPDLGAHLRALFEAAGELGLDLDFHTDESLDPKSRSLEAIATAAMVTGFAGRIVCGHCCSLASMPVGEAMRTLDVVARAGIAVVSLPMCNLYLQDRYRSRTPRRRGVTLIREMRARGIPIAVASDNTRDPFYAYGDLDLVEVVREAVRIAHLDHPIADAPALVARAPAEIAGFQGHGRIVTGNAADLIVFDGRGYSELFSRPESARLVLRSGRPIDSTLPDYRELDDLMAPS